MTLVSIQRLSEYLGVSLGELFTSIESDKNSYEYTLKQEQYLAKHPVHLALYDQLVRGRSVKQIIKKFGINEVQISSLLLMLDKIQLIELHENYKVKLLKSGEPKWRKDGPLSKRYKKEILDSFLSKLTKDNSSFYMHEYLQQDVAIIHSKVEEIKKFLVLANKRATRSKKDKISYGVYIALREFDWDLTDLL